MNCPDCNVKMESDDQSSEILDVAAPGAVKTKPKKLVSVRYFCGDCCGYWRWTRGVRGLNPA